VDYAFFKTVDVELFEHLFEHPAAACNYNALRTCSKRRTPILKIPEQFAY